MSTLAPTPLSREERVKHDLLLDAAWDVTMTVCEPNHHPIKPTNQTRILECCMLAELMGYALLPHQICIVATATEVESDDNVGGPLKLMEVLLSFGRQSGKSASLIILAADRLLLRRRSTITWAAQVQQSSVDQVDKEFWPQLQDHDFDSNEGVEFVKSLANPHIRCSGSGSQIKLRSTGAAGGARGGLNDLVVMDEIYSLIDFKAQDALGPTLSTRHQYGSQALLASTPPLENSDFLEAKLNSHEKNANKPGSRLGFWHWGADEKLSESQLGREEVWRKSIPGLAFGLIHEDFIRKDWDDASYPLNTFKREWLNIRVPYIGDDAFVTETAFKNIQLSKDNPQRVSTPRWVGIDAAPDQSVASIVAADSTGVFELVDQRNGISWVLETVTAMWSGGLIEGVALQVPGPLSGLLTSIEAVGANHKIRDPQTGKLVTPVVQVNGPRFAQASQQLLTGIHDSRVAAVHSGGVFLKAVNCSRRRHNLQAGTFTIARRTATDEASAIVAAAFALNAANDQSWMVEVADAKSSDSMALFEAYYGTEETDWGDDEW